MTLVSLSLSNEINWCHLLTWESYIAIWDNRSAFHSATFDYDGLGERAGNRVVGIGEKPYLDPNSKSKAEALAAAAAVEAAA